MRDLENTLIYSTLNLKKHISTLEKDLIFKYSTDVFKYLEQDNISDILAEKMYLKRISAQVDVAIHAYGILVALAKIMDDDEVIEYLSLGAGNTGKAYDVCTSKRIAEFKFAKWDRSSNTMRQNSIFKDFLELAIYIDGNGKEKYIYCLSAADVIKFLSNSNRNLGSVLSRNTINKKYPDIQERYKTVKEFYQDYKEEVKIIELSYYLDME